MNYYFSGAIGGRLFAGHRFELVSTHAGTASGTFATDIPADIAALDALCKTKGSGVIAITAAQWQDYQEKKSPMNPDFPPSTQPSLPPGGNPNRPQLAEPAVVEGATKGGAPNLETVADALAPATLRGKAKPATAG